MRPSTKQSVLIEQDVLISGCPHFRGSTVYYYSAPNKEQCQALVAMFLSFVETSSLSSFAELFLLRSNSSQLRWQAHQLLYCLFQYATPAEKLSLVEILWGLWPAMPNHGHKAAQFVDLLGYLTVSTPQVLQKVSWGRGGVVVSLGVVVSVVSLVVSVVSSVSLVSCQWYQWSLWCH